MLRLNDALKGSGPLLLLVNAVLTLMVLVTLVVFLVVFTTESRQPHAVTLSAPLEFDSPGKAIPVYVRGGSLSVDGEVDARITRWQVPNEIAVTARSPLDVDAVVVGWDVKDPIRVQNR
jgi:hypothetical protein